MTPLVAGPWEHDKIMRTRTLRYGTSRHWFEVTGLETHHAKGLTTEEFLDGCKRLGESLTNKKDHHCPNCGGMIRWTGTCMNCLTQSAPDLGADDTGAASDVICKGALGTKKALPARRLRGGTVRKSRRV